MSDTESTVSDRSDSESSISSYDQWSPMGEGITLAWRDLSVYVHTKSRQGRGYKRIINNVSGAVKAGSLVALMGSSGAGKSTLMCALAYKTTGEVVVEGDIVINGRPIGNYMKNISGFMHQEDLFIGALTVHEHMYIMAKLKLERNTTEEGREAKINDLLKQLGLLNCINTKIGYTGDQKSLSGGEKKRLAFATELLTNPPLLFCDEPTTGLDSYSAHKIVTMMNKMASQGRTIVCTIHQPSSQIFAMFSQLLLVADGRIAYLGSTEQGINFFKEMGYNFPLNYNPADFFVKTLSIIPGDEESSKHTIRKICDRFAVSEAASEIDVIVQYEFHTGRRNILSNSILQKIKKEPFWWTKLFSLVYRGMLEIKRVPQIQLLRMLQKIGIAFLIGLCYFGTNSYTQAGIQSVQGYLFMVVTENTFTPMYSVLDVFPQELPLFIREYRSGMYGSLVYYLSKILILLPGMIIDPILYVVVGYWMSGLRNSFNAIATTILAAIFVQNVSGSCGYFFSTAFESAPSAIAYLVPFDYVLMITSGVFVKLSSLGTLISWTKYLSWLMYGTEAMTVAQWKGVTNITCENPNPDIPCLTDGSQVIDKYSFKEDNIFFDFVSMSLLYVVFHALGYLFLFRKVRRI